MKYLVSDFTELLAIISLNLICRCKQNFQQNNTLDLNAVSLYQMYKSDLGHWIAEIMPWTSELIALERL